MEQKIVKMPRSQGDVLSRMKAEYVRTEAADASFRSILAPLQEASEFQRHGGEYTVSVDSLPSEVFTSFNISVVPSGSIPGADSVNVSAATNQSNATISKVSDTEYRVDAKVSAMVKYLSSNPHWQGAEYYWLAVAISTGETSITNILYNGVELTEADVEEANSLSLSAGAFVLWLRVEEGARTLLLSLGDKSTVVKISVADVSE